MTPTRDYETGLHAYLIVDPNGQIGQAKATINRDRAYDYARNAGQLVARVPVVVDQLPEETR